MQEDLFKMSGCRGETNSPWLKKCKLSMTIMVRQDDRSMEIDKLSMTDGAMLYEYSYQRVDKY